MDLISTIACATGVFFGNWLLVPFLVPKFRNYREGFWIGLIAAILVFAFVGLINLVQ